MSNEEQEQRTGSVAHAFGQALATQWAPTMPTALKRTGLPILLYAMRQLSNATGALRYTRDGKPVRLKQIAAAACCAEKDARRYVEAALLAGVVQIDGERKRGSITAYQLIVNPFPDWDAAVSYLRANARKSGKARTVWQTANTPESSGHRDPNSEEPTSGHRDPNLRPETDTEPRVTATHWSSGHRDPLSSGHRDPNNPWNTHEVSHDGAEVVPQPQVVDGWDREEPEPDDHEHDHEDDEAAPRPDTAQTATGFARCAICHRPLVPDPKRPARTTHAHCTAPHAKAS
ncbi:hypothetical protein ABZ883_14675 [Streptomyces sp. NPDC046977]|uniref:hypothetical protein n=1 Tax=Streptomyces sp. NPDC046977 TaxID=3154703 RepID=UPI0033EBBD89